MQFDKVSILDDTIMYLQDLEKKVGELESRLELPELEGRTNRKQKDSVERTSDNYGNDKISNRKTALNKRKASNIDEMEPEIEYVVLKDGSKDNLTVSINDKNVLIDIKCTWREGILIEIMDAISSLHLDSHSVQSSTGEGVLSVTIKSKVRKHETTYITCHYLAVFVPLKNQISCIDRKLTSQLAYCDL